MTSTYPELSDLPDRLLAQTAVLDGEIVALDTKGRPDFGLLQNRMNLVKTADIERAAKKYPVEYFLFDLLELDGTATLGLEYSQRREILKEAVETPRDGHIQVPPELDAAVEEAVAASREVGLEGIIAKTHGQQLRAGPTDKELDQDQEPADPGSGHCGLAAG